MPSDNKKRSRSRGRRDSRDKYSERDSRDREDRYGRGFSSKKGDSNTYARKSKFDLSNDERQKSSGFSKQNSKKDDDGANNQNKQDNNFQQSYNYGPIIPQQFDLPSRKIYVGGIAAHHTEVEVAQFIGAILQKAGACVDAGNPVIRTSINRDKRYLFVELRTAEEAACVMQIDGIDFQGYPLRIRRCQEYNPATAPPFKRKVPIIDTVELGIVSTQVQETPNKVFVGGIPKDWDEDKIKKLLVENAGKLRSFHLVRDNKDQSSKGYAFCEFASLDGVQMAMQTIHGMKVLDQTPGIQGGVKTLNVRRTGVFANQNIDGSFVPGLTEVPGINPNQRLPVGGLIPTYTLSNSELINPIDIQNKQIFENNISLFIKTLNCLKDYSGQLFQFMQNQQQSEQLKQLIDNNNQELKDYLKKKYQYEFCTTSLEISIPAIIRPQDEVQRKFREQILQSQPNKESEEYKEFYNDMKYELSKFGVIDQIQIRKIGEKDEGKVLVKYFNISSAFVCYNLLNGKKYLGTPVDILFIKQF